MACFPVREEQLAAAERALGIALPAAWTTRLLDPRMQRVLAHPRVGALREGDSMEHFVALTLELRERQAEFPRDGVVFFCGIDHRGSFRLDTGYPRFWLPDPKQPRKLGDAVFAWDPVKRRRTRDGTIRSFLDSMADSAPVELFDEVGLPRPVLPELPPLLTWLQLADAQARRAMTEPADIAALASEGWIDEGRMTVSGAYLTPCDLGQDPSAGRRLSVKVEPGEFVIRLRYASSRRRVQAEVAAVQLVRVDAGVVTRTSHGLLEVDAGGVALFDRQTFQKQVAVDDRESAAMELMAPPALPCLAIAGRRAQVLLVPSGEGDGVYPVFALRAGTQTVGIEIEFMAMDAP